MGLTWEEFMKISNETEYVKPGEGDSYYTQEFLDEERKRRLKPKKESTSE